MKISIITPTIRKKGLDIVRKSLLKQEYKDFEWLIGSKFDPQIPEAHWIKDDFKGGYWSLNRCWNQLFKRSKGELVVFLQDNIYIPSDGVKNFWINYQSNKSGIFTGVGDQYEIMGKYCPEVCIWKDPRRSTKYGTFYEINWNDIEYNWAAVPLELIYKVGGADEKLDWLGYGADLYQMSERLNDLGHKFYIDQSNESFTVRHEREREDWDTNHVLFNGSYEKRKQELKNKNIWPKLPYLDKDVLEGGLP